MRTRRRTGRPLLLLLVLSLVLAGCSGGVNDAEVIGQWVVVEGPLDLVGREVSAPTATGDQPPPEPEETVLDFKKNGTLLIGALTSSEHELDAAVKLSYELPEEGVMRLTFRRGSTEVTEEMRYVSDGRELRLTGRKTPGTLVLRRR